MDNLNANKILKDLTPEELENLKGGFQAIPTSLDVYLTSIITTIGIILPPSHKTTLVNKGSD